MSPETARQLAVVAFAMTGVVALLIIHWRWINTRGRRASHLRATACAGLVQQRKHGESGSQMPESTSERQNAQRDLLRTALSAAVPLRMLELKDVPVECLLARAPKLADVVASQGDALQFGGGRRGTAAKAFNALADGLAILALTCDGGVDWLDMHWDREQIG